MTLARTLAATVIAAMAMGHPATGMAETSTDELVKFAQQTGDARFMGLRSSCSEGQASIAAVTRMVGLDSAGVRCVAAQLLERGYGLSSVKRTGRGLHWLILHAEGLRRDVIVHPHTGEILRDEIRVVDRHELADSLRRMASLDGSVQSGSETMLDGEAALGSTSGFGASVSSGGLQADASAGGGGLSAGVGGGGSGVSVSIGN